MDIFEKCATSTVSKLANQYMQSGLYPYFRPIETGQDTEVYINGKKFLMLGSNSYLGLTSDKRVIEAANAATKKYGTGNAGSRFLNGTLDIHEKLEKKIAALLGREQSILYSTGYQTNVGVISALVGKNDVVVTDKSDHASIIDGCKLSLGEMTRFRHQDMAHLERVLQKIPDDKGKLIVVDGVYSMEGDIANLPEIIALSRKYDARVMVDDAHAIGVIGKQGRGTASYWAEKGAIDENDVDIITGTFSKSWASLGGFCACSSQVMLYLRHVSRSLIFSASMTPGTVGAVSRAIDIMLEEPERIEHLWNITRMMYKGLKDMGYDLGSSETPIIPVYIGEMNAALSFWRELTEHGLFVNPVVPPAVADGECLMRTSFMATHTEAQIEYALGIFEKVGKKLGILSPVTTS
jgi:8-amino-7-oxononanoate synthase